MANSINKFQIYFLIVSHIVGGVSILGAAIFYIAGVNASIEANKVAVAESRAETSELRKEVKEAIANSKVIELNSNRIIEIENDVQKNTEEILKK